MTNKALREFRTSLVSDKGVLLKEGARIATQLESYGLKPSTIHRIIRGDDRRVGIFTDGFLHITGHFPSKYDPKIDSIDEIEVKDLTSLVENSRRRLAQAESRVDKIIALYPTDIAELTFDRDSYIDNKRDLIDELVRKKKDELEQLFNIEKDSTRRLYLELDTHGITFVFDLNRGKPYASLGFTTRHWKLNNQLDFLLQYQEIKLELQEKLRKLFGKGVQ